MTSSSYLLVGSRTQGVVYSVKQNLSPTVKIKKRDCYYDQWQTRACLDTNKCYKRQTLKSVCQFCKSIKFTQDATASLVLKAMKL